MSAYQNNVLFRHRALLTEKIKLDNALRIAQMECDVNTAALKTVEALLEQGKKDGTIVIYEGSGGTWRD